MIGIEDVVYSGVIVGQKITIAVQTVQGGVADRYGRVHVLQAAAHDFLGVSSRGEDGNDKGKAEKQNKGGYGKVTEYFMEINIVFADGGTYFGHFHMVSSSFGVRRV